MFKATIHNLSVGFIILLFPVIVALNKIMAF